jgi:hypothetical protein
MRKAILILIATLLTVFSGVVFAQTPAVGRVKGTLTHYFNENNGSKPDVGSKVWLIEGNVEIPETVIVWDAFEKHVELSVEKDHGQPSQATKKYKMVKCTVADGSGNFELSDVPTGQYTLVIESNHSKRPQDIGRGFTMQVHKVKTMVVALRAGETFEASNDFGMSIR